MLVTLKEILEIAKKRKCAIGSFNTPGLPELKAVISAAEQLNEPVIIMHAQVHEEMGLCKMDEITPIMLMFAERAKVPVCVHLDHGTDVDYVKRGLELGFTSVMYDGSEQTPDINFENTCKVREFSMKFGASLEAEVGSMGSRESAAEGEGGKSIYTEPEDAKHFAEETGIDALACAFGTAHGLYLKKPQLDFPRLAKIYELVDAPLVMHGGSGVSREDYKKVIELGIRKINYYSYMSKAGGTAAAALNDKTFFHDIAVAAEKAMKEDVMNAIKVFGNCE